MKCRKHVKSILAVMVMALMFSAAAPAVMPGLYTAEAAKKKSSKKSSKKSAKVDLKINTTSATVKVGKSVTLKVSGNAKKTVKWSSTSNCVKLSKKSGTKIKVKGEKEGVAAVIAKVGSAKVVCAVYVGKASYADASSKTKKALGNPIKLLAAYIAKHPISVQTGNTNTNKSSWEGRSSNNTVYSLSVQGSNLVVSVSSTWTESGTNWTETGTNTTAMSIPTDGNPIATVTNNYSSSYTDSGENGSYSETYSFPFNINTITPGTEVSYYYSWTNSDGSSSTSSNLSKRSFINASAGLVDVLYCFLVDNHTGFTTRDIGFAAYPATHMGIGMLTSADMAAFSQQIASIRSYNQAHDVEDDD